MTVGGLDVVVVAGLSGAGRSTAADALEDLGWFVIDNLPPALIPRVAELAESESGTDYGKIVLVVGIGPHHDQVMPNLQVLAASGSRVRTLFLDASTDILVLRYKVGRRRHPMSTGSLHEAIDRERAQLDAVRIAADLVIDTTNLNIHELRDRVALAFSVDSTAERMLTRVMSFGYKHGVPTDVDLVFDCRFLPNPHWVEDLRPLTGLEKPVSSFVLAQELAQPFLDRVMSLLEFLLPAFRDEGRSYLTIAFGCTGGHHRSVAVAEEVARMLSGLSVEAQVAHRDIDR